MARRKDKKKINELTYCDYPANVQLWELWENAYEGGYEYICQRLIRHAKERNPGYKERVARATLLNYLDPVCNTFSRLLFRKSWNIQVPTLFDPYKDNVDKHGTPYIQFMQSCMTPAAIYGQVFIGVDEPAKPIDGELTIEDLETFGIRPYLYMIEPEDMREYHVDEDGNFDLLLLREEEEKKVYDPVAQTILVQKIEQFRLWTLDYCRVFDCEGNLVEEIPNPIGVIPVVPLKFKDNGHPVFGSGLGKDIEPIQAQILNLSSQEDQIYVDQTFSQLVIFGQPSDYVQQDVEEGFGAQVESEEAFLEVTTSKAIMVPKDTPSPTFIAPKADQATLLSTAINAKILEIYRIAGLTLGDAQPAVQSGVAKAYDFLDTNQALEAIARNVVTATKRIFEIIKLYQGDDSDYVIDAPHDFGIVRVGDLIKQIVDAGGTVSPLITNQLQMQLANVIAQDNNMFIDEVKAYLDTNIEQTQSLDQQMREAQLKNREMMMNDGDQDDDNQN